METIVLQHISLERLKNAEHMAFHTNVRNFITTAGAEAIGLNQLVFNPYRDAILEEQDIVNRSTGSAYTKEMQEADKVRDMIFKRIRHKLQLCELEDTSTVAYKATPVVQKHLLGKYGSGVVNLPYQEQTATLAGFVLDCRELLTDEQVEGIGIDSDLDDLESANIKFGRMYQERVAEKAMSDTKISAKLRQATDAAYLALAVALNALANDPTPANEAKVTKAREVVGKVNVVIKEVKDRLNQRTAPSDSPQGGVNEVTNGESNGNGSNSGGSNASNPSNSGGSNGANPNTGGNEVIIENPGDNYE